MFRKECSKVTVEAWGAKDASEGMRLSEESEKKECEAKERKEALKYPGGQKRSDG